MVRATWSRCLEEKERKIKENKSDQMGWGWGDPMMWEERREREKRK